MKKLLSHSVENYYKMRSRFLRKNQQFFRQINVFTKEVTKKLISRNFSSMKDFSFCNVLDWMEDNLIFLDFRVKMWKNVNFTINYEIFRETTYSVIDVGEER